MILLCRVCCDAKWSSATYSLGHSIARMAAPYTSHPLVFNSLLVILGSMLIVAVQKGNTLWPPRFANVTNFRFPRFAPKCTWCSNRTASLCHNCRERPGPAVRVVRGERQVRAQIARCCTVNERPLHSRIWVSVVQHDIEPLICRRSKEVPGNPPKLFLRCSKRMIPLRVACVQSCHA